MMLFFETIKALDGKLWYQKWHERRAHRTQKAHFTHFEPLDLTLLPPPPTKGLWRCKVIYGQKLEHVEYHPYTPRIIRSLRLIHSPIQYPYKALERGAIENLFGQRDGCDDILIHEDGLLKDTSIANIALFYKGEWLTPKEPLLFGTTRERLLDQGKLKASSLEIKDLAKCEKIALFNAMTGFFELDECIILKRSNDVVRYFTR